MIITHLYDIYDLIMILYAYYYMAIIYIITYFVLHRSSIYSNRDDCAV